VNFVNVEEVDTTDEQKWLIVPEGKLSAPDAENVVLSSGKK
jgi:hypothetical protein